MLVFVAPFPFLRIALWAPLLSFVGPSPSSEMPYITPYLAHPHFLFPPTRRDSYRFCFNFRRPPSRRITFGSLSCFLRFCSSLWIPIVLFVGSFDDYRIDVCVDWLRFGMFDVVASPCLRFVCFLFALLEIIIGSFPGRFFGPKRAQGICLVRRYHYLV